MLLVIDIGNSDIVFGRFEGEALCGQWRIRTDLDKTADEYGVLMTQLLFYAASSPSRIRGVIISSVVPALTSVFQEMSYKYFQSMPMLVTEAIKTGLTIRYDHPEEVGSDRIVNAAAAYALYGGSVIIVDLGTATTFCVVTEKGEYLGGAIAPGMALSAETLFRQTAKLPRVELKKPGCIIGNDTTTSMQSGIVFGYIGLINEIVTRLQDEIGTKCQVIATGGLADLIASECHTISLVRPSLTLEGLMIIYEMNRDV